MNRITVGLSKPKTWTAFFKAPDIFIEVPVSRKICVSFYLLQITKDGTSIRLANRFYKSNKVLFSKSLAISRKKEIELIDWGKTQASIHTSESVGSEVLGDILGIKKSKKNKFLSTKNPFNIFRILKCIGEEKVRYSCVNFLKK